MTGREPDPDEAIEAYLDELLVELHASPRLTRRVLAEAEAHLRDAVDNGLTAHEAIARFGDARDVASRSRETHAVPLATVVRQLAFAAFFLGSIGLLAVGVSGLVAAGMHAAWGPRFVAGDLPDVIYTPQRCAELAALAPHSPSCLVAAARHHTTEVETYRVAAGMVGAVGIAVCLVLRRRRSALADVGALPRGLVSAIGATVFGVATLALTSQAMQSIGWHTTAGLGQWLSAAIVAAACAAMFTVELVHELCRPSYSTASVSSDPGAAG
jgi:hypothetical protein